MEEDPSQSTGKVQGKVQEGMSEKQVDFTSQIPQGGELSVAQQQIQAQMTEQLRMKITQTLTRFAQQMKGFRENQKNVFEIRNPNDIELINIIKQWRSRPVKNERFLLTLELIETSHPKEMLNELFQLLPSIQLIYNGEKIQSNGVLVTDGEYFYQGNERYMLIISESRETEYEGQVLNKLPHGKGMMFCKAKKGGYMYKGTFFAGKFHGSGQLRNSKNVFYAGEFKDDYKHGQGVEYIMKRRKNPGKGENPHIRKSMYKGQFKEGERCGEGTEETPHGIYKGNWQNNVKSGKGEIVYRNGDRYEGQWQNNQFCGQGVYVQKGNLTYTGSFQDGKYHGKGIMEYLNGDKYEGDFQKGKKHGMGIYTWSDGDYYDGEWKNDSAQGHGTSMIGTDFYDGEFKNGRKHGQGELTDENGDVLKAIWENNKVIKQIERNGEPVEE